MKESVRKISSVVIIALLLVMLPAELFPKAFAATTPYVYLPGNYQCYNGKQDVLVRWEAPTGTVSKYTISVRELHNEETNVDNTLILNAVEVSSSKTNYTISKNKLSKGSTYRISVCAVLNNGSKKWSNEVYFFTSVYKIYPNKTFSFYMYSQFPLDWKNAIYYSAQTWNNTLNLGYEYVNTYPLNQCHNSTTFNNNDGVNRITNALPGINDTYVMRTKITTSLITGELLEVDININDRDYDFTVGASPGKHDIQAVMTHEMGHVLGLPDVYESFSSAWTMHANGSTNSIAKRSLENAEITMFTGLYLDALGGS